MKNLKKVLTIIAVVGVLTVGVIGLSGKYQADTLATKGGWGSPIMSYSINAEI